MISSSHLLPWNSAPGRSIDIELGGQEVINIELDSLESEVDDVIEVLKDGQPKVGYWTRLAGEYLRRGYLDAAEKIALCAVESTSCFPSVCTTFWIQLIRVNRLSVKRLNVVIAVGVFFISKHITCSDSESAQNQTCRCS